MTISYRGLKKTAKVVVLNGDILGSYETKFTTIPEIEEEDDDTDDPYGEYEDDQIEDILMEILKKAISDGKGMVLK